MAGHSKWSSDVCSSDLADQRRGALFTKLIREITIAAKQGGGDPAGNARLRTAIDAAKAENMPLDNIERAVKKGTGELEGVTYEEVTYEAYGPGGAALLIEATTDNANRTVAEIRNAFQRHGGNLGATNSVAWMFDRKAQITVDATRADEDAVMEAALDAGADDLTRHRDIFLVTGPAGQLHQITERLKAQKIAVQTAEIALISKSTVRVDGKDAKRSEEHTSELQSQSNLVCRLLLEKKQSERTRRSSSGSVSATAAARVVRLHSPGVWTRRARGGRVGGGARAWPRGRG